MFKKYTLQEALDEIDVIEKFDYPGKKMRIGEVTKKQEGLFNMLEVKSPTLVINLRESRIEVECSIFI